MSSNILRNTTRLIVTITHLFSSAKCLYQLIWEFVYFVKYGQWRTTWIRKITSSLITLVICCNLENWSAFNDWLIDCCFTSFGQNFSHIQDRNKFRNKISICRLWCSGQVRNRLLDWLAWVSKLSHVTVRLLKTQNDMLQWIFNVLRTWNSLYNGRLLRTYCQFNPPLTGTNIFEDWFPNDGDTCWKFSPWHNICEGVSNINTSNSNERIQFKHGFYLQTERNRPAFYYNRPSSVFPTGLKRRY